MKLQIFVIHSCVPGASLDRVAKSFPKNMKLILEYIDNDYSIINRTEKKADWYCVIYDNEVPDIFLAESLEQQLRENPADALGIYRKLNAKTASKSIRFFRKDVKINPERLLPQDENTNIDYMLNGWFEEYDPDKV